ncbi:MAG: hypothetical protein K2Q34_03370 [Alphaproteobacteria bacterium]|nr:hypothetical protein [Alphaproteobacteria bacterium]
MLQRSSNLFTLNKSVFLSSFFIICSLIAPIKDANAAEAGLTVEAGLAVEDIRREAENYLNTGKNEQLFSQLARLSARPVDPNIKAMLETVKSSTSGQTLKDQVIKGYNNGMIYYLFKIIGLEWMFKDSSLNETCNIYSRLAQYKTCDPQFIKKVEVYLKDSILPTKQAEIDALVDQVVTKGTYSNEWVSLKDIIQLAPTLLNGQKLENLDTLFDSFVYTSEGRQLLRAYRLSDGSNLLQHYVSKWNNSDEQKLKTSVWDKIKTLISSYALDNVTISSEILDINGPDFPYQHLLESMNDTGSKELLLTYCNSKSENFAHLICDHVSSSDRNSILSSLRSAINNDVEFFILLNATDQTGRNVKSILERTRWGIRLLGEIDPYQLVQPNDCGMTPLMKMALDLDESVLDEYLVSLQRLGINTDQQDVYGNTTRSLSDLRKRNPSGSPYFALLSESFKHHPLNANLWDAMANFRYFPVYPYYLFADALHVVSNQPHQTPVHHAFLQLEATNEDVRREARDLWKAFYRTYDKLMDKTLTEENEDIENVRRQAETRSLPLAGRYLMSSLIDPHLLHNTELTTKILAGSSIFGLNFSRKVTPLEAGMTLHSINELAMKAQATACIEWQELHVEEAADLWKFQGFLLTHINKMVDSFFEAYPRELDEKRQTKLLNHRLNQSVVAVSCFLQKTDNVFELSNEEDLFSFVDKHLQSRIPVGKAVNSKVRMEKISGLLPEDFEFSLMPGYGFYKYTDDSDDD